MNGPKRTVRGRGGGGADRAGREGGHIGLSIMWRCVEGVLGMERK